MSELQPVAKWRKILIWIGAVCLWVAVIGGFIEGAELGWRAWLGLIAAIIVTITAIDFTRRPTQV